jgi:hypothetical protein
MVREYYVFGVYYISTISLLLSFKKHWMNQRSTMKKGAKKGAKRGGKWSMKYKRSIDCNHPKGFSQKQHCQYGRRSRSSVSKKNRTEK